MRSGYNLLTYAYIDHYRQSIKLIQMQPSLMSKTARMTLASCGDDRLQVIESDDNRTDNWVLHDAMTGHRISVTPQEVPKIAATLRSLRGNAEHLESPDHTLRGVAEISCLAGRLEFYPYFAPDTVFWTMTDTDTDMSVHIHPDELTDVCSMLESFKQRCKR